MNTIIIIGAGAAGLMAARTLSAMNFSVVVLEAAAVTGGRIRTLQQEPFVHPLEAGAEFVHGKLPVSLQLLKEAGIAYEPIAGSMERIVNGQPQHHDVLSERWEELMERLQAVQHDITVAEFLEQYFAEEQYAGLRDAVQRFAEGYDLADIRKASVFALREEWMNDEEEQYRLPGGYKQLIGYLEQQCIDNGCKIHTSHVVKNVEWSPQDVRVTCANGNVFTANKIIVTVSPGVLSTTEDDVAHISFKPAIASYIEAVKKVGFGAVIKVHLLFSEAFWLSAAGEAGFFLSDESVPTWWVQAPREYPLLTGWLGGPATNARNVNDEDSILQDAIHSLARIFNIAEDDVRKLLKASHIVNWCHEPFTKGAYSYATIGMEQAVSLLTTPVEQTIFFAGEAVYSGAHPGTVEAALVTGQQVAAMIAGK
ncbi:MAG: NAD(P)/FAD-dependent oxidoreductase [Chitinophagaceae bacterium]